MNADRTIRRLTNLSRSASTARVLNLHEVNNRFIFDSILCEPFFKNPVLNRSIILKHTIRPAELELFEGRSGVATKVLIPIDESDLRAGAHCFFVGERAFEGIAEELFNQALRAGSRDRIVLDLMDQLPSLDPFLLRENLRRVQIEPAREYFNISDSDVLSMQDFVRNDIKLLVEMSSSSAGGISSSRLADKLLSNHPEADLGPLRSVLKLDEQEFLDGIFAWRGFLYYKWVLTQVMPKIEETIKSIASIQPRGLRVPDAEAYIPSARSRIIMAVRANIRSIEATLDEYDIAYMAMTIDGQPRPFRDFLICSPAMFFTLGCQLGALQHIISFWHYRFPRARKIAVGYHELMDIFVDFETGITAEYIDDDVALLKRAG